MSRRIPPAPAPPSRTPRAPRRAGSSSAWASSFSSVLGVWNGVSVMFADFWGHVRGKAEEHPDRRIGGKYYRFYVLWLTFPPMLLCCSCSAGRCR